MAAVGVRDDSYRMHTIKIILYRGGRGNKTEGKTVGTVFGILF